MHQNLPHRTDVTDTKKNSYNIHN